MNITCKCSREQSINTFNTQGLIIEQFLSATVTGECNPSALNINPLISLPIHGSRGWYLISELSVSISLSLFLSECVYKGQRPGAQQVLFLFCVNKDSVAVESAIQPPPECEVQAEDLFKEQRISKTKGTCLGSQSQYWGRRRERDWQRGPDMELRDRCHRPQ